MQESKSSKPRYPTLEDWLNAIPEEFRDASFESSLFPPRTQFGLNWAKAFPLKSMFIFGGYGTGKTTFAFSAIREAFVHVNQRFYFWPRYVTGRQLSTRLLKASKAFDGNDEWEIETWSEVDLLFIDEIEKVEAHERFRSQFFEIFNRRHAAKKPTIVTSNCEPKALGTILDPAIISRMSDKTKWEMKSFGEIDLRMTKKEAYGNAL